MDNFTPNNELERSLMEAATDAGKRPAFYRQLLHSQLIVLGDTNYHGHGNFVAGEDTQLRLVPWRHNGKRIIAVFSSLPRLHEAIKREANYVQLDARTLFGMLAGSAPVVLNPTSACGKEFTQAEIASLLDGSIFSQSQFLAIEQELKESR
ncbi:MAG: SseB family protein [Chloroflexi bacterium]|nr:SseB family protein [Chloroflexota bacterium]